MSDLVSVKFTASAPPFNTGEVAGVSKETADKLVEESRAVLMGEITQPAPEPEAPTPPPTNARGKISTSGLSVSAVRQAAENASARPDARKILNALLRSERSNPEHRGGRTGAMRAINNAIEALEE